MNVILKNCYVNERSKIRGYTFWEERLCRGEEFHKILALISDEVELFETAKRLSGSFVFSINIGECLFVVTDIIRSVPAFWGMIDNELVISDDYEVYNIRHRKICQESVDELLATSYITGDDTLFEGVHQLQPARIYCFKNNELLSIKRYYFESTSEHSELDMILNQMVVAYDKAIDRLITYLNGRQAVIPLSGGLDGRFIASCLKKKGYHNIVSFTYGREEKDEVLASKKIAETLGLEWLCVPYESKLMQSLFYSEEFEKMAKVAGNITTMPHIQDWYAMNYLTENNLIDKQSVLIPGHAASNMAELAPVGLESKECFELHDIVSIILETNYIFWNVNKVNYLKKFSKKISERIPQKDIYSKEEAYEYVKDFCYDERQAKLIANSVRIYEYYGYDWYMPFWDTEVVNAWHATPKKYADNRQIYYCTIQQLCPGCVGISRPVGHEQELGVEIKRSVLQKIIARYMPILYGILRSFRHQKNNLNMWGYLSLRDRLYGAFYRQKFADAMWVREYVHRNFSHKKV